MWTTCYICRGNGSIFHHNIESPCYKCNHTQSTIIDFNDINMIMIGQIWIDDCIEPVSEPSSP